VRERAVRFGARLTGGGGLARVDVADNDDVDVGLLLGTVDEGDMLATIQALLRACCDEARVGMMLVRRIFTYAMSKFG
jgi:hypothetical protein